MRPVPDRDHGGAVGLTAHFPLTQRPQRKTQRSQFALRASAAFASLRLGWSLIPSEPTSAIGRRAFLDGLALWENWSPRIVRRAAGQPGPPECAPGWFSNKTCKFFVISRLIFLFIE
jgi:hypothetical protein